MRMENWLYNGRYAGLSVHCPSVRWSAVPPTRIRKARHARSGQFFQLGLECEIAVWLRADITGSSAPFTHASVAEAVAYACVSIEIVEHRFSDFALAGTPSLIADDFFSVGCVHAAPMPLTDLHGLAHLTGGFSIDGASPEHEGSGAEILGHPLSALVWLAEHVSAAGEALRAGQLITLGSVVKTIYPQAGTLVEARFDDMPSAHVHVT